jgi:WD40 repeat protein
MEHGVPSKMSSNTSFSVPGPRFVNPVTALAFSSDNKWLLSGYGNGTVKIWDIKTHKVKNVWHIHEEKIVALKSVGHSRLVVSASDDATLRVWDWKTGNQHQVLDGHRKKVSAISLLPDNKRVISASMDGTLKLWNLEDGREICTLIGHEYDVFDVIAFGDGLRAISVANNVNCSSLIWNLANGTPIMRLPQAFRPMAIGPNDELLVTARHGESDLMVWDLEHRKLRWLLSGHTRGISSLYVDFDVARAVSGSTDGTIRFWNLQTGKEECFFEEHDNVVISVTLLSQGKRVISTSKDCSVKLFDCDQGRVISTFVTDSPALDSVFLRNHGVIIVGDASGGIHFLEMQEDREKYKGDNAKPWWKFW